MVEIGKKWLDESKNLLDADWLELSTEILSQFPLHNSIGPCLLEASSPSYFYGLSSAENCAIVTWPVFSF